MSKQPKPARKAPDRIPAPTADSYKWMPWALAALAFVLFAFGFRNQMIAMDDHAATVDNLAVKNWELFGHFNLGMYAPVTWLGYAIAYSLGKNDPVWYHLLSALVHAANTFLVFRLFNRLDVGTAATFLITLFFAIHPMQVEAVSWIAGFSTPLYALFSLLALDQYVQHVKGNAGYSKSYWMALGMFLLACLSKSAAVSIPLCLLVLDMWMKRPVSVKTLIEKVPFFAISLAFGILTLYSRVHAGQAATPADFSLIDRALMICQTILFYWTKMLVPTGLSIWYPFIKTNGNWPWVYYAAPFILTGLIYGAWRIRKQVPFVWFGILFYLACLLPALPYATFGTFELRSDRYGYLACLGIFAILAMLPGYLAERKSSLVTASWVGIAGLGLVWLFTAGLRIRDWHDTITLIDSAIESNGDNFGQAYLWRGMEYGDQGKVAPAMKDFSKAIEVNPNLMEAYKYRGSIYGYLKKYDQSLADLNKYLEKNPGDAENHYNRALTYINLNRFQEAMADLNKTLELNPDFERAYRARGETYKNLGDAEKGAADIKEWERRTGNVSGDGK
jgi:uncharacterized membrane protein (Fun14 family)